jgi:amino acid transporter
VIYFTSFVGVEDTTNYGEESRPGTIGRAMVISVLVGVAIYALSAWAMSVATGPGRVVGAARAQGSELMFNLAGGFVGGWLVDVGHVLFLTSLFASALSFHNTTARYLFALGREGVLPRSLGLTSYRTGSPKNASMTQSAAAAVIIVAAAVLGWDPMVNMFFWLGTLAGLGVIVLMTLASVAVIGFFGRDRHGEHLTRRVVFPALAALSLGAVAVLILVHYATLLGAKPGDPISWQLPLLLLVAFLVGLARAGYLYRRRRNVFDRIGLGAEVDGRTTPTLLTVKTA